MGTILIPCGIALGIGLIVVLGIRGLPISKRGIQSIIQMDGANFLKTDDGNIKIKRRTFFTWLMTILFGACDLGLIIGVIKSSELSQIIKSVPFILLFGFLLFLNIRILLRPSAIQLDVHSKTITIGRGATEQHILFSQVNEILFLQANGALGVKVFAIRILLNNDKVLEIGSVSGNNAQAKAVDIIQQIAEITGAKIREA
jgi:hypothetical protein